LRGIESVRTGPPGRAHHAGERADLLEDRETPYARGAPPRDVRVYRIGGHVREAHRAHPCLGRAAEPAEHRRELLLIHLDRRVALTLRTLQLDELRTPIDQELAPRPLLRDRVARVTREEHTSLAECAGPGDRARFRALRAPGDRVCPEPDDPASPIVPPRELWIFSHCSNLSSSIRRLSPSGHAPAARIKRNAVLRPQRRRAATSSGVSTITRPSRAPAAGARSSPGRAGALQSRGQASAGRRRGAPPRAPPPRRAPIARYEPVRYAGSAVPFFGPAP